MRPTLLLAMTLVLCSCAPAPPPAQTAAVDPTTEAWYPNVTRELAAIAKAADDDFRAGRFDAVAASIGKGQPLEARLLAAPRPTLAAMEAASDLDDVYGRMLVHNERLGFAREFFQKNVIRWKNWKPQTPETERRWKAAVQAVAECERRM